MFNIATSNGKQHPPSITTIMIQKTNKTLQPIKHYRPLTQFSPHQFSRFKLSIFDMPFVDYTSCHVIFSCGVLLATLPC